MNNRGFVKTIMIILLLFLVVGLYYYTEPTKEILGMLTAKTDINESSVVEVAGEIDSMNEGSTEDAPEEAEPIEESMADASTSAHLLVAGSGESNRDILSEINSDSDDNSDED